MVVGVPTQPTITPKETFPVFESTPYPLSVSCIGYAGFNGSGGTMSLMKKIDSLPLTPYYTFPPDTNTGIAQGGTFTNSETYKRGTTIYKCQAHNTITNDANLVKTSADELKADVQYATSKLVVVSSFNVRETSPGSGIYVVEVPLGANGVIWCSADGNPPPFVAVVGKTITELSTKSSSQGNIPEMAALKSPTIKARSPRLYAYRLILQLHLEVLNQAIRRAPCA